MFPLSDLIFLRGMGTSCLEDNATINKKGMMKGLDKLETVIDTKNLNNCGILSDNLHDEVRDYCDNLIAVTKKVDPTHPSVTINKHDIIAMNGNRGGTRGMPNIKV